MKDNGLHHGISCIWNLPSGGRCATDSELKGRWTDPPAEKWPFSGVLESRRIGASRCPSLPRGCASVDSTPQNSRFFFLARLVWFSATGVILDFGNCSNLGCINKGRRGFVLYVTQGPQIHSLFCCCTPTSPRTAALKFDHCFSSGSVLYHHHLAFNNRRASRQLHQRLAAATCSSPITSHHV
jgi:hypothetical protein